MTHFIINILVCQFRKIKTRTHEMLRPANGVGIHYHEELTSMALSHF